MFIDYKCTDVATILFLLKKKKLHPLNSKNLKMSPKENLLHPNIVCIETVVSQMLCALNLNDCLLCFERY